MHWVGATHTPSPSLLGWALCKHLVPSKQFSSSIKLSLSGDCYLSKPLLLCFDQSVSHPDLQQIATLLLALHCPSWAVAHRTVPCKVADIFCFEWIPLGCLTSVWLFTQPNSLTSPKRLSVSGSVIDQLFSNLQVSPSSAISLVPSQPLTTVPAGENRFCVLSSVSLSPEWLRASRSLLVWNWLPGSQRVGSCEDIITHLALLQSSCTS